MEEFSDGGFMAGPGLDPLLGQDEKPAAKRRRWPHLALVVVAFTAYVCTGALERVCFARMTAALPADVLLMHTLLGERSNIRPPPFELHSLEIPAPQHPSELHP